MSCALLARDRFVPVALLLLLAGCSVMRPDPHLAAFTTQLTGTNEVPTVSTAATGRVDAVLDKNTGLFRWRLSYAGLSGPATAAHFHGPAPMGRNAGPSLSMSIPLQNPGQGRATLNPAQTADLLAGRWYANIHTATHPGGEIRGQMTLVD
ncbi:CHRD domain-containing protein [Rhodoferax sp. PAMC 29310]|uniref:CHRD domain-containing protein n=1 Tax=Rhodoferax sp. PAMC 29310 TaxID=2822760 RepID=UPI001B343F2A|nr:CHRD domain-containing protein [Rhodoferax sp. PAMC 29310]